MLRRRSKAPLLAEIPLPQGSSSRSGALGRGELGAYSGLVGSLAGTPLALLTGPAKTEVAIGLAAAATAAGRRVALLECDLASPALAATLGLELEPGFGDYLRGEAKAERILQPLVLAGPASGQATDPLVCIVAGRSAPPPSQLLDSDRCKLAIERLARAYDLLIIDGPSLAEDPSALAALAECAATTILCAERTKIPRRPSPAIKGIVVLG
jgi:succinoglycan biosynthesis transport protein ExoP